MTDERLNDRLQDELAAAHRKIAQLAGELKMAERQVAEATSSRGQLLSTSSWIFVKATEADMRTLPSRPRSNTRDSLPQNGHAFRWKAAPSLGNSLRLRPQSGLPHRTPVTRCTTN